MSHLMRQNELKLDILHSLARSQRALADILGTIPPMAISSEQTAEQLLSLIEALNNNQHALASKLCLLPIRQVKKSKPGKPWLARKQKVD
jgi:hypothetical protein